MLIMRFVTEPNLHSAHAKSSQEAPAASKRRLEAYLLRHSKPTVIERKTWRYVMAVMALRLSVHYADEVVTDVYSMITAFFIPRNR